MGGKEGFLKIKSDFQIKVHLWTQSLKKITFFKLSFVEHNQIRKIILSRSSLNLPDLGALDIEVRTNDKSGYLFAELLNPLTEEIVPISPHVLMVNSLDKMFNISVPLLNPYNDNGERTHFMIVRVTLICKNGFESTMSQIINIQAPEELSLVSSIESVIEQENQYLFVKDDQSQWRFLALLNSISSVLPAPKNPWKLCKNNFDCNGRGLCIDGNGLILILEYCSCSFGYEGIYCQFSSNQVAALARNYNMTLQRIVSKIQKGVYAQTGYFSSIIEPIRVLLKFPDLFDIEYLRLIEMCLNIVDVDRRIFPYEAFVQLNDLSHKRIISFLLEYIEYINKVYMMLTEQKNLYYYDTLPKYAQNKSETIAQLERSKAFIYNIYKKVMTYIKIKYYKDQIPVDYISENYILSFSHSRIKDLDKTAYNSALFYLPSTFTNNIKGGYLIKDAFVSLSRETWIRSAEGLAIEGLVDTQSDIHAINVFYADEQLEIKDLTTPFDFAISKITRRLPKESSLYRCGWWDSSKENNATILVPKNVSIESFNESFKEYISKNATNVEILVESQIPSLPGGFRTDGCMLIEEDEYIYCKCNHMTDFSIVYQPGKLPFSEATGAIPPENLFDLKIPRYLKQTFAYTYTIVIAAITVCVGLFGLRDLGRYGVRKQVLLGYIRYLRNAEKELIIEREKHFKKEYNFYDGNSDIKNEYFEIDEGKRLKDQKQEIVEKTAVIEKHLDNMDSKLSGIDFNTLMTIQKPEEVERIKETKKKISQMQKLKILGKEITSNEDYIEMKKRLENGEIDQNLLIRKPEGIVTNKEDMFDQKIELQDEEELNREKAAQLQKIRRFSLLRHTHILPDYEFPEDVSFESLLKKEENIQIAKKKVDIILKEEIDIENIKEFNDHRVDESRLLNLSASLKTRYSLILEDKFMPTSFKLILERYGERAYRLVQDFHRFHTSQYLDEKYDLNERIGFCRLFLTCNPLFTLYVSSSSIFCPSWYRFIYWIFYISCHFACHAVGYYFFIEPPIEEDVFLYS